MIVRAYDELWNVDKRLYQIGDIAIDRPPLYSQIAFFAVGVAIVAGTLGIFHLNNYDFALVKYIALPIGFSMFMTSAKFDGKRPDRFLRSVIRFYLSPHLYCRYERIRKPDKYIYEGRLLQVLRKKVQSNAESEIL